MPEVPVAAPALVLINGAPGAGKSTVAAALAATRLHMLALDVDALKHALGGWADDPSAAGLTARRLALAVARQHLEDGHDVVLGQYLARSEFVEQLEHLASATGARFVEVLLDLTPTQLEGRLRARHASPDRSEHGINNRLVSPDDAEALVASLDHMRASRRRMTRIDGSQDLAATVDQIAALLR